CPQPGRKGQPPAARPQGAAARCKAIRGNLAARAAACKGNRSYRGNARARRHRLPARYRLRAAAPATGATAHVDGVQRRCLRRALAQ
ncbi:hypothetical protein GW17_00048641, partial [Ensete ventricosum]